MSAALITAQKVAEVLGTSVAAIQKMCQRKQIPHYKVNSNLRFKPAEIDRWVEAQRVAVIPRLRKPRGHRIKAVSAA